MSLALGGLGRDLDGQPAGRQHRRAGARLRTTLGLTAVYGVASLAWLAWRFEETVPARNPRATEPRQIPADWRDILAHPTFRAWTLLLCSSYGGLFVMLASSSFVFLDVLGTGQLAYGAFLAWTRCSMSPARGLPAPARRPPPHRLVRIGAGFSLAGGLLMAALALAGALRPGHRAAAVAVRLRPRLPPARGQSGSVSPFASRAGTAASLSGFAMMTVAFAIGLLLGRVMNGTVFPLALGVGASGVCVALVAWTLVQRHGMTPAPKVAVATEMAL